MIPLNKEETKDKIIAIIAQKLSINKDRVTPETTLQDLGADSLDIVEIIMRIEEDFNIEINDEQAEKLKNVQNVIDYVHSLRKQ